MATANILLVSPLCREYQLSTLILIFSSILTVFLIYAKILSKFYKRKRNYESIREESRRDFYPEENSIKFSATSIFIIPITFEPPSAAVQSNVVLQKVRYNPGNGRECKEIAERTQRTRKSSNISRGVSFHVSYIKSSNYILIILLTFS